MGRSPFCEKMGLKKGQWTPEEDQKLLACIEKHGHGSWRYFPAKAGLQRCGKSCRLRWINYLRPDIKRGKFSLQEEQTIIQLHALLGNRWSVIAAHLPKRTDNEIKNYWNSHLKKRLTKMGIDPVTHRPKTNALDSAIGQSKDTANLRHVAQWESARLEAEARIARESKLVSNPPRDHHHLGERSTTSAQLTSKASGAGSVVAPPARPQCLDVLKAWQLVVSGMFGVARDNLEPPTSTLNFHEQMLSIPPAVGLPSDNTDVAAAAAGTTRFQDSFRSAENIMEDLSDMMIFYSGDQEINSSMINAESSNGNFGGDFEQENTNYWNSVMNLVNASTSWSPVF